MADELLIFCSPLGMYSLLRSDYIISVLKDDGSLDEERLTAMVRYAANRGANALRDFSWIDSKEAYEKISPFWHRAGDMGFNHDYFRNQRRIALICKAHGVRYYISLFDHCGTKGSACKWNPWRYFNDFFYGEDAKPTRHQYIKILSDMMHGLDYGVDICNEPKPGQAEFLADTFLEILQRGFDPTKIILGIDYFLKKNNTVYSEDYVKFTEKVCTELGTDWDRGLRVSCISPVRNVTMDHIKQLWGPDVRPGGEWRIMYSTDDVRPRPDRETMRGVSKYILETKYRARKRDKIHFEVVFGRQKQDPLDSVAGISESYKDVFGAYPANFGRYPDAVYPVEFPGGGNGQDAKKSVEARVEVLENRVHQLEDKVKEMEL